MIVLSSSLFHRWILVAAAVLLLATIGYKTLIPDSDDPYRCRSLLNTGRWLDPVDENGNRTSFTQWQPEGCLFHEYSSDDIQQCMEGRHIAFSGDSTTRQVVYGISRLVSTAHTQPTLCHTIDLCVNMASFSWTETVPTGIEIMLTSTSLSTFHITESRYRSTGILTSRPTPTPKRNCSLTSCDCSRAMGA
jgi:hypothetical protein